MTPATGEIRRVDWPSALPFLRLFGAAARAINFSPLLLGFLCAVSIYVGGRVLDAAWSAFGRGALCVSDGAVQRGTEIELFATLSNDEFRRWVDESNKLAAASQPSAIISRQGPFQTLLLWEMRCGAAAIEGVLSGRIFFGGGVQDERPALLTSVGYGLIAVSWLMTRFPVLGVVLLAWMLLCYSYFGSAICRVAAVYSARGRWLGPLATLGDFAAPRWLEVARAPGLFLAAVVVGGLLLFLQGLVGGIPVIGPLLTGVFFGLSLLLGAVMTFGMLGIVFAVHLAAPVVAVEKSDAFDAWSRACTYVLQRPLTFAWYALVALISGSLGYCIVRLVAMMTLKCANTWLDAGMSAFGQRGGQHLDATPLGAIWRMPDWSALAIVPNAHAPKWWGEMAPVLTSNSEWLGMLPLAIVIYLFVGVVLGYAISFYFTAATDIYLLLRQTIDGADLDQVEYQDDADLELNDTVVPAVTGGGGSALPIVGQK